MARAVIRRRKYIARSTKPICKTPRKAFKLGVDLTHKQKVVIANDLWRHEIYKKEPSGICPRCFLRKFIEAAHIFAKGPYPGMRFELDNGIPLCRTCHRRIDSDHKAKELFAKLYIGEDRYARLDLMSQGRGKTDVGMAILYLRAEAAK